MNFLCVKSEERNQLISMQQGHSSSQNPLEGKHTRADRDSRRSREMKEGLSSGFGARVG